MNYQINIPEYLADFTVLTRNNIHRTSAYISMRRTHV